MNSPISALAGKVRSSLAGARKLPSESVLVRLFEVMYFSSMRTEEGNPIAFHIVYLDPESPDPRPPRRIVQNRWNFVRLEGRIEFEASALVKLAKASDPRSSSLAVYSDSEGGLFVWGLIDQGHRYYDFIHYNSDAGPERPGLFQASIVGVGQISVFRGYELIADLRVDRIRPAPIDALKSGALHAALLPSIQRHLQTLSSNTNLPSAQISDSEGMIVERWLAALRRLLLRIQQYRHGGAVLITPDSTHADLRIKYSTRYSRLKSCLSRMAEFQMKAEFTWHQIFELYDAKVEELPVGLHFAERSAQNDLDECSDELNGALWFISLLSRVDGLILLSDELEVRGFGVEILSERPPQNLAKAIDRSGSLKKRAPLSYDHFGTRHRSMMRYCAKVPGSVGFVISQDGDVRAMTLVGDTVMMWENLTLRLDNFDRRPRKKTLPKPDAA